MCVAWPILPELVPEVWAGIEPLIASALEYANGENTTTDVRARILNGRATLWLMIEPEGPVRGVMVTEIIVYPQQRLADVCLLAGERQESWLSVASDAAEAWGRQKGCAAVIASGRRGWWPFVEKLGYRVVAWHYRKDIE
jgi:hypothetical protein